MALNKRLFAAREESPMSVDHIDLTDPDHFNDGVPHHWFKQLRAESPVHWQAERDGAGFWAVTKYEDVKFVSREPSAAMARSRTSSSRSSAA